MAKSAPSNGSVYWEQRPRATRAGQCNPCIPRKPMPKTSPPQGHHRPWNRKRWIRPMRPNTSMKPGDTSGAPPTHCSQRTEGQCIWLWRRKSDSSPCPLRVLQGSSVRHSATNPKQLATAALSATISYNLIRTPRARTATAARRTNQTRDLPASTGSVPRLHHICGFSA